MTAFPNGVCRDSVSFNHEGARLSAFAGCYHLHGTSGCDRGVIVVQNGSTVAGHGKRVLMLDQQPVGALGAVVIRFHAHQHKAAMQSLTFQREFQIAFGKRLAGGQFSF